jgi:hypothetical protein
MVPGQAAIQIFLNLVSTSIPFCIRNAKVAGILLLIVPTISFTIKVPPLEIFDFVGFVLFLVAGIMALVHKKDESKKKRKAFSILLDFLDKINSVNEWNQRLHELHTKLSKYEYLLPSDIRRLIDNVTLSTDLDRLRKFVSEELRSIVSKLESRISKILLIVSILVFGGFGAYTFGLIPVPPILDNPVSDAITPPIVGPISDAFCPIIRSSSIIFPYCKVTLNHSSTPSPSSGLNLRVNLDPTDARTNIKQSIVIRAVDSLTGNEVVVAHIEANVNCPHKSKVTSHSPLGGKPSHGVCTLRVYATAPGYSPTQGEKNFNVNYPIVG